MGIVKACALAAGAASAILLAACASAPAADSATALADSSEQVCKRLTPIGSNMPKRVCATAAEWAAQEKSGQEQMDELARAGRGGNAATLPQR